MENEQLIKELHPLEIRVLLHFGKDEPATLERVQEELGYKPGQSNQAFSWLTAKQLIEETERRKSTEYSITDLGREYKERGTPEERVMELVRKQGALTLPEITNKLGLENKEVGSAYGALAKAGLLAMNEAKQVIFQVESTRSGSENTRELLGLFDDLETVAEQDLSEAQKTLIRSLSRKRGADRGMFRVMEREQVSYRLTPAGLQAAKELRALGMTGEEIGQITPELLRSEKWKSATFRSYNINTPPLRVLLGLSLIHI